MFNRVDQYSDFDHSDPFSENFGQKNQCSIEWINIRVLIIPTPVQKILDKKSMFNRAGQYSGFDHSDPFSENFGQTNQCSIEWINIRVLTIPTPFQKILDKKINVK